MCPSFICREIGPEKLVDCRAELIISEHEGVVGEFAHGGFGGGGGIGLG